MNETAAIVVTYNRKELLSECLTELFNMSVPCDVIVIDNNSDDGTSEMIKSKFNRSDLMYFNTKANLGGAGGFNYGIKTALSLNSDYKYLWLMDDDTIVSSDALEKLFEADNHLGGNYGFLYSRALWTDGSECKMNIPTTINHFSSSDNNIEKISKATFVSFFIKTDVVKKYGLPIKDFFIWADDSEYSLRISKSLDCYWVKDSIVTHKMKSNVDANYKVFLNEESNRSKRFYYSFRNRFYIAKKQGLSKTIIYSAKLVYIFLLCFIIPHKKQRITKAKIVLDGFIDGMRFNPIVEYIRDE